MRMKALLGCLGTLSKESPNRLALRSGQGDTMIEEPKQGVTENPTDAPVGTNEPSSTAQPTPEVTGDPSTGVKQVPLPALQEERSKRQTLEAEIAELRSTIEATQYQQQMQQQPQQQAQADPRKELEELWENDPRKAVQVEIMYAMDWRDRIDASLETQAGLLAKKYPDFNNYRASTLGQVRSLPLNQRGQPGILEASYFMVRGQNADSLIQQREAELLEKYRKGEITAAGLSTPPGGFSTPAPVSGNVASEEQAMAAAAMGLTAEQYMSGMK